MAYLEITCKSKARQVVPLAAPAMVLGREASADIVLQSPYISAAHARIEQAGDGHRLLDLQSANGTYLNGSPVRETVDLHESDVIRVGEFELVFHASGHTGAPLRSEHGQPNVANAKVVQTHEEEFRALKNRFRERLIERLNLKKLIEQVTSDEVLRRMTEEKLDALLDEMAADIPGRIPRDVLRKEIIDDTLGLGPLEDLLADDGVTEIMVNRWDQIYYERAGKLHVSPKRFADDAHVMAVIQRIVAPVGRAINESSPLVDARLPDGSRVNAIIPPLALHGPALTIRKFAKQRLTADDLVRFGSLNREMVAFLDLAVRAHKNIIISGGTGSGKTTLLNILSGFIPSDERIVTVEDAAELRLHQEHVVSLESRPPNLEGKGAITIRDLVRNCLRMRPDRIVVGECRGGEALDMLQAMNTGHDGSLTTAHANSPRELISRLETMVLMSGMELPVRAIRDQIASAVDLIVHQSRMPDGSRKITHITEVTGMEGEVILLQDIFTFEQQGFGPQGEVVGTFKAQGLVPEFVQDLIARGMQVDLSIFHDQNEVD